MENLIQIIDRQVVISNRYVAEKFSKAHKHVLASIKDILSTAENSTVLFQPLKNISWICSQSA
jgi:phage regulator Rha-like protein